MNQPATTPTASTVEQLEASIFELAGNIAAANYHLLVLPHHRVQGGHR